MGKKNHLQLTAVFALGFASVVMAISAWEGMAIAAHGPQENTQKNTQKNTQPVKQQRSHERLNRSHSAATLTITNDEPPDSSIQPPFETPVLLAAPQNLNPRLAEPASPPNTTVTPNNSDGLTNEGIDPLATSEATPTENPVDGSDPATEARVPFVEWDDLEIDLSESLSNFGQGNRILTPILRGHLANGDTVTLSPGFNQFSLPNVDPVVHVPLTLGWEGNINDVDLRVGGGLDIYNRLPLDTHFTTKASVPVWTGATLSLSLDQGPYLFNAETLENGISTWRYGPDLFWQIDPKTSLFSLLRIGHFNDGNFEQQSFSRLERKFWNNGAIAANLFNWSFQQDLESASGYFSPPDFLVASLELSWEQEIIDNISCRIAGNVGQQRLNGSWAMGYGHQALCSFPGLLGLDLDLGYSFSNVGDGQTFLSEDSAYNNFKLLGGIQTQF